MIIKKATRYSSTREASPPPGKESSSISSPRKAKKQLPPLARKVNRVDWSDVMERKSDGALHQPVSGDYGMINESLFINEQQSVARFFCEDEVIGQVPYPKSVSPDKFNVAPSRLKDYPGLSESFEWPKSGKISKMSNETTLLGRKSNWEAMELIRSTESSIADDFKGKEMSMIQLYTERNRWNEALNSIVPESTIKGSTTLSAVYKICSHLLKIHHRTELLIKEQQESHKEETLKLKNKIKELDSILRTFENKEKRDAELKAVQDAKIKAEIEELFKTDDGKYDKMRSQINLENYKESGITDCLHDILRRLNKEIDIPQEGYLNFSSLSPEDIHSSLQSKLRNITHSTVAKVAKSLIRKPELDEKSTETDAVLIDKAIYDELLAKYDNHEMQSLYAVRLKEKAMEELKEVRTSLDKVTFEKKGLSDNLEMLKQEINIIREQKRQADSKIEEVMMRCEVYQNMNLTLEKQVSDLSEQLIYKTESISLLKVELENASQNKPGSTSILHPIENSQVDLEENGNTGSLGGNQSFEESRENNEEYYESGEEEVPRQGSLQPDRTPTPPSKPPRSAASNPIRSTITVRASQESNAKISNGDRLSPSHSKETIIPKRNLKLKDRKQSIPNNQIPEVRKSVSSSKNRLLPNPPEVPESDKLSNRISLKESAQPSIHLETSENTLATSIKNSDSKLSVNNPITPSKPGKDIEHISRHSSYRIQDPSNLSFSIQNPDNFELRDSVELTTMSRVSYIGQGSQVDMNTEYSIEDTQENLNPDQPLNESMLGRLSGRSGEDSMAYLKPVVSVKYVPEASQQTLQISGVLPDSPRSISKSPIPHKAKVSQINMSAASINTKKSEKRVQDPNTMAKSVFRNAYIDRGSDSICELLWQKVYENSKGVQYSQDYPEFNTVESGDGKKEYLFSFNPNNVFGLKGDVYFQGMQRVFQAMSAPSDNTGKNLYKRISDIAKYNV